MKVLVIDDERSIREHLEMFLQEKGFEVLSAETGEAGIQAFREHEPDILISDIRLPGIDGLEVLRRIKRENNKVRRHHDNRISRHGNHDSSHETGRIRLHPQAGGHRRAGDRAR